MDITQTQSTSVLPQAADTTETQSDTAKTTLSSDFETFLKMLTVQMENQDPLNPIDSADYAVQLATFSSVEQQVKTNDLLTSLSSSMAGGGLGTLGQWVGMEVRGSDKAYFDGSTVDLNTPGFEDADRRILLVANEAGQTMARVDLDLSTNETSWDGVLATGNTAADGVYSFRVEGYKSGQLIGSKPAESYGRVREARVTAGGAELLLDGNIAVASTDVTALRDPQLGASS